MPRPLTVFLGMTFPYGIEDPHALHRRQFATGVACRTNAEAAQLLGVTARELREYWGRVPGDGSYRNDRHRFLLDHPGEVYVWIREWDKASPAIRVHLVNRKLRPVTL